MANATQIQLDGTAYNVKDVGSVRYDGVQSLTDAQKEQAVQNIGTLLRNEIVVEVNNGTAQAREQINDIADVLEHPVYFVRNNYKCTGYITTVIQNMRLFSGIQYNITATIGVAVTRDSYLQLYKGETLLASETLAANETSRTFTYNVSTDGSDYSVKFASPDWLASSVSVTVVPQSHGSIIDNIPAMLESDYLTTDILQKTTTKRYMSSNMYDGWYVENKYVRKDGTSGNDNNYCFTRNLIRVNAGDTIIIGDGSAIRQMRFVTAYKANFEAVEASGAESVLSYTVPAGIYFIRISASKTYFQSGYFTVQNNTVLQAYDAYNGKNYPIDNWYAYDRYYVTSSNLFTGQFVSGKLIRDDGSEGSDNNYGYTKDFIRVIPGDNIIATSSNGIRYMRFIAAYDINFHILSDKGLGGGTYTYWTVPDGVFYIRVTCPLSVISSEDFAIYQSKSLPLYTPDTYHVVETRDIDLLRWKREPFRLLPSYFVNTMSYRQLGRLSKGYICIVSDDGTQGLASYTIPLAISENIPMTFAVMKESEVFADNTMRATVLDAVNNHGCSLAQHGGNLWDMMSEKDLNNFFDIQEAYFTSLGVTLRGAVIPQHRTNTLVKAVAGGRFGVVRSGYSGVGPGENGDVDNNSIQNFYDYYTSGERSNVYGLSSYNCAYATKEYNHAAADFAKANNKIMVVYFHEFDTYEEQQEVVEDLIIYAKTIGLEFITLGDIPTLETWDEN